SHVINQVLKESLEHERRSLNAIVYGIPEFSSSSIQRISDDSSAFRTLLKPHSIHISDNSKIIRLDKVYPDKTRPPKLLSGSKEFTSKLVSDFVSVKNGALYPTGFRIVNDKTLLQRNLLRSCHAELDNRRLNGKTNLEISNSFSSQPIHGFYQNCQELRSKLSDFICNAAAFNHLFIILSETWLTNGIYDNELGLYNYNVFRCDRSPLTSNSVVLNLFGFVSPSSTVTQQYVSLTSK
ncbi:Hypothetical protein CINCED_3A002963, partial [Cinara cedri]